MALLNKRELTPAETLRLYHVKRTTSHVVVTITRLVFLIAFSYILLYPIFYILSHAFRNPDFFGDPTVEWVPKSLSLDTLVESVKTLELPTSLFNTLLLEVVSALISIVTCGLAAYGMARYNFKGKKILGFLLILMILIPANMTLIPSYVGFRFFDFVGILKGIGGLIGQEIRPNLLNSVWTFYLPAITATGIRAGFYIYIYMQFYKGLPKELEEAAWVDGCSPLSTYIRIVVPSSGTAVLTVSLLCVIWYWNDYYAANMFMDSKHTMAVVLNNIFSHMRALGLHKMTSDAPLTCCLLFMLPLIVLYLILQKRFITSIASTGIVG